MTTMPNTQTVAASSSKQDTWWDSRVMRRFRRNTLALIGLAIVVVFFLVAVFAPLLATPKGNCLRDLQVPQNSSVYNPAGPLFWKAIFSPPESCFLTFRPDVNLGAPQPPGTVITVEGQSYTMVVGKVAGYDVWYALIWGTRLAFQLAFYVTALTAVIGVIVGAVAGYFGGWIDNLIMRVIDVIYAIPGFILTVVLVALMGASLRTLIIALTVFGWAGFARVLRGDILKVRQLEFVDGARAIGAGNVRIIFKHVLPNALSTLIVVVVLSLGAVPLTVAALSFIGLGLPQGYADWGQAFSFARLFLKGPEGDPFAYWYTTFFPALTIILWGLGWNLLGDAVRDAIDPRER
jgi:peptide/nickel transport system permease protein